MDYKFIEQLLERYFDCATTASEERMLRAFFSGDDVPEALLRYKALFDVEAKDVRKGVSAGFKSRVLEKAGVMPVVEARPRTFSLRLALRPLYNAVAAIAIVMLVGHLAQVSFSDEGTANEANIACTEQIDSTAAPTLENLKAVGDGQRTAVVGDSASVVAPEPTVQGNAAAE